MKIAYGGISTPNKDFEYFRKGVVGSSRQELSADLVNKLEEWNKLNLEAAGVTSEELYGV